MLERAVQYRAHCATAYGEQHSRCGRERKQHRLVCVYTNKHTHTYTHVTCHTHRQIHTPYRRNCTHTRVHTYMRNCMHARAHTHTHTITHHGCTDSSNPKTHMRQLAASTWIRCTFVCAGSKAKFRCVQTGRACTIHVTEGGPSYTIITHHHLSPHTDTHTHTHAHTHTHTQHVEGGLLTDR